MLFFVSFTVGVKGILLVAAAIHSLVIFYRLYAQFFIRYRRILYVYLTFKLSLFSLFLSIISFCFSPFLPTFSSVFVHSNALVTIFSFTVFTAFRYRVRGRPSRTTFVKVSFIFGSLFLFLLLYSFTNHLSSLRAFFTAFYRLNCTFRRSVIKLRIADRGTCGTYVFFFLRKTEEQVIF